MPFPIISEVNFNFVILNEIPRSFDIFGFPIQFLLKFIHYTLHISGVREQKEFIVYFSAKTKCFTKK